MHEVPPLPDIADAPEVLSGHLWLQEFVDGTPIRFQVRDAAPIRFGDDRREFGDDAPRPLRYVIHEVQRALDREALRSAVDDVETITFVGRATHRRRVDYDWRRLPGFLGTDIWDAESEAFLPPDRTEQAFRRLGLKPLNVFAKEVRAADFQPERYDFPISEWRDGPAAGVVLRNKTGGRARLPNPGIPTDVEDESAISLDHETSADERAAMLADEFATENLFEQVAAEIRADGTHSVTFDSLHQGGLDAIYREHAPTFERVSVNHDAFQRAIAERTSEYIGKQG